MRKVSNRLTFEDAETFLPRLCLHICCTMTICINFSTLMMYRFFVVGGDYRHSS